MRCGRLLGAEWRFLFKRTFSTPTRWHWTDIPRPTWQLWLRPSVLLVPPRPQPFSPFTLLFSIPIIIWAVYYLSHVRGQSRTTFRCNSRLPDAPACLHFSLLLAIQLEATHLTFSPIRPCIRQVANPPATLFFPCLLSKRRCREALVTIANTTRVVPISFTYFASTPLTCCHLRRLITP